MIRTYLKEKRSWLLFFISLQLLLLFFAYVDVSVSFPSMVYYSFLSTLLFVVFVIVRYHRETRFYKQLEASDHPLDVWGAAAHRPLERIVENSIAEQLEQLKRTVERNLTLLEQEKDELLSWIHEVKTPLTAMRLIIDRLEEGGLKAPLTYEWLRIHLLLDQQLHLKRLPFLENDLLIEQLDLQTLLFMEIKTLKSWCIQKGVGFEVELGIEEVLSDAKWLAFIIRQLLTNAVKYSDQPSDILIRSYDHNGHAMLDVKDAGRGIDPKDLPRIFNKGFTSTNHHSDSAATGMGLYLANKAAEALHMQITVQSELHAGTTFTLKFPKRNDFIRITGM